MVKYLTMMTMMMMMMMKKLKASHYFCVQGVCVSCGTEQHRRCPKGRHELRQAPYNGSPPTFRIFVTFPVGDFTEDSRENSTLIEI
jgi:hypothetical protein